MSQNPFGNNPYASPTGLGNSRFDSASSRKYPTFCRVMFIISLGFSSFRLLILPLGILGLFVLSDDELTIPVVLDLVATGLMAIFGILASTLLLARQPIGIPLAWFLVSTVVFSIGIAGWQVTSTATAIGPPGSPEQIGFYIVIAVFVSIRIGLLALYCIAVSRFSTWLNDGSAVRENTIYGR